MRFPKVCVHVLLQSIDAEADSLESTKVRPAMQHTGAGVLAQNLLGALRSHLTKTRQHRVLSILIIKIKNPRTSLSEVRCAASYPPSAVSSPPQINCRSSGSTFFRLIYHQLGEPLLPAHRLRSAQCPRRHGHRLPRLQLRLRRHLRGRLRIRRREAFRGVRALRPRALLLQQLLLPLLQLLPQSECYPVMSVRRRNRCQQFCWSHYNLIIPCLQCLPKASSWLP